MNKPIKLLASPLLCLLIIIALTACSSRTPVDAGKVRAACENAGLKIDEEASASILSAESTYGITEAVIAQNDSSSVQGVIFADEASARSAYANISSSLNGSDIETVKQIDSATYNKLYVKSGDSFAGAVRIQNTLFYGEDNGSGSIEKILAELGY